MHNQKMNVNDQKNSGLPTGDAVPESDFCMKYLRNGEDHMEDDSIPSKITIKGTDTSSIRKALDAELKALDISFEELTFFPPIGPNSLTHLKLSNCYLGNNLDSSTVFPCLIELSLNSVFGDALNFILSRCPSVEILEIINCYNVPNIQLHRRLSKIKKLEVTHFSAIDVNEPSLETLKLASSSDVQIIKVDCHNLRELDLSVPISIEDFKELLLMCPCLEVLVLKECIELERLEISHHRLKNFTYYCLNGRLSIRTLKIDTPILQSFKCAFGDHTFPSSIAVHAPKLLNFEHEQTVKPLRDLTLARLRWHLKSFRKCSRLSLTIHGFGQKLNRNFLKKVVVPPPDHNIDLLKLIIVDLPPFDFKNLLDSLLWIVRPSAISVGVPDSDKGRGLESLKRKKESFLKFLCKELMAPNPDCCDKKKVKCWRYYLKMVEIPGFESNMESFMESVSELDYQTEIEFKLIWDDQISWFEETPTRGFIHGLTLQDAEQVDPCSPDNLSLVKDHSLTERLAYIDARLKAGGKTIPEFWFLMEIARIDDVPGDTDSDNDSEEKFSFKNCVI